MRSAVSCARTAPTPFRWPRSITCSTARIRCLPSSRRSCGDRPSGASQTHGRFDIGGKASEPAFLFCYSSGRTRSDGFARHDRRPIATVRNRRTVKRMKPTSPSDRLRSLSEKGVQLVDERQVFIDEDVSLDRIHPGSVLFPGTRLSGAKTLLAPGARIGSEGPATIIDSAIGENAEVASGFVAGSVLLDKARIGANGHIRPGTLLEEEASTAHAVGLKHTILTSFVTLGSLINCCDCLISGGRSRANHTEIGSGFIHFNFTPWGDSGDKATPSLIGGVPRGVFLREERIFVGGLSGMVGPTQVGFGTFTVAGQMVRSDIGDNRVRSEVARKIDAPWDFRRKGLIEPRAERNLEYIGHLAALRAGYAEVRKPLLSPEQMSSHLGQTLDAAIGVLDSGIDERTTRLQQFLSARNVALPPLRFPAIACPLQTTPGAEPYDHIAWVRSLSDDEVKLGTGWLQEIVETFVHTNRIA